MTSNKNHHDPKQIEALLRSLEYDLLEHNEFFDRLVDMIPSKLYVSGASGDDYHPAKYLKGSHADSKPVRRAAAKEAKRRKLDPALAESTVETKARIEMSHATNDSDDDDDDEDVPATGPVVRNFPPAISAPYTNHEPGLSRIEILKKRLHDKIQQKQHHHSSQPEPAGTAGTTSKRAARRAEKLRRREEAQKRADSSKSAVDTYTNNNSSTYKVKDADRGSSVDPARDLKHLDFGRLAGFQSKSTNYLEVNKALGGLAKNNKNLQKMLTEAEEKKQKLEKLKDGTDEEKDRATAIQWKDALKEADGIRVRDDTTKIKKALKRKAASKAKSQKAWKTRMDQQQEQGKNRQNIRQHNLQQRKRGGAEGANLSKKRIVDPNEDKGRRLSRAGFEGKKQGFLNSTAKE